MIFFAILLLVALVVAVMLYKQGTPYMGWVLGAIVAASLYLLVNLFMQPDRPEQVTDFEAAVGWKLADHISGAYDSGEVIIIQESSLKDGPSGIAQRKGVEKGLRGITPLWKTLTSPDEFEAGEPGTMNKRAQALVQLAKDANNPVAILSFVPLDQLLNDVSLKQLPPVYLYAAGPDPVHERRLTRGEYGGVVTQKLGADFTKQPAGSMEKRFDQRFQLRIN